MARLLHQLTLLTPMPKAIPPAPVPVPDQGPASALPATYEAALEELESLVARLESGDMPLDQLISGYQRGAELLNFCRGKLETVENQIKVLEAGTLKPWMPE